MSTKKFLYLYFGGNAPKSAEEGQKVMQAWMAYFGKMGDKIVDGGAPLGPHRAVGGAASAKPSGYSIVNAASLDEAVRFTDGHPHLMAGGSIEVCETQPIPM
ncbi:MAG: hypothetical protein ISS15_15960 [Alphaproteobacteria bacterium]|nr:hypothetical protein [Alphaproteobacteria bacterium]MBL6938020.1 hypothetical protein [Alphaproteobacteria bacterium]MBL7099155.1 hypothetical protein [Alphaproteobacteria bacterium]